MDERTKQLLAGYVDNELSSDEKVLFEKALATDTELRTELEEFKKLKEMIGGNKDKLVVVKADRTVVLNKAVKIMDLAKAAGAARLCLATEKGF